MRIGGSVVLAAQPKAVHAALRAPGRLVDALPNVEDFGSEDGEAGVFDATISPAIALGEVPVRTRWTPKPSDADGVRYLVEGHTDENWLFLDARVALHPDGDGTRADWTIDYEVGGTLASVGQRVLPAVVATHAEAVLAAIGKSADAGNARR